MSDDVPTQSREDGRGIVIVAAAAAPAATGAPPPASGSDAIASECRTASIFVGRLHPRVGEPHLQKLFSPYGAVRRIAVRPAGGYAFVEYASVESARMAIRRIDGRSLLGRDLVVRPARDRANAAAADDGAGGSARRGGGDQSPPDRLRLVQKERSEVESRIEAVKKALKEKRARNAAGASFDRAR